MSSQTPSGPRVGSPSPPGELEARMVVAYYLPHNEGVESGILDAPGQTTGLDLVDLYEVDGEIRTFENRQDAEGWLQEKGTGRQPTASQTPPDARWTVRTAGSGQTVQTAPPRLRSRAGDRPVTRRQGCPSAKEPPPPGQEPRGRAAQHERDLEAGY
jgi:hypothetical protein